jgi:ubiquinone/menaquinone biosynthesis C-methylase UbiE
VSLFSNRFVFNWGSAIYDRLTDQDVWRDQVVSILRYVDEAERPIRILDLGCGPGGSAFALAGALGDRAHIVGIDIAQSMVEKARQHHQNRYAHCQNIAFQVADATALPFDDGAFDLAVGHSFLYLVPDQLQVLSEVCRVLQKPGRLVLMEPRREGSIFSAIPKGISAYRNQPTRGRGVFRFAASMVAWRCVSTLEGQLTAPHIEQLFLTAGFQDIECHPTLAGLGWHCVGTT